MTFQIEQILTIENKTYVLTKSINDNVSFRLCDKSLLGDFEIENWCDIPKARDSNGDLRTDNFSFVLKNESDTHNIKQGDILGLSNLYVAVVESNYTISGKVICVLECGTGMLDINTILTDNEKRWRIAKNNITIGRPNDAKFRKRVIDSFWFLYNLEPIDHAEIPYVGQRLQITPGGS